MMVLQINHQIRLNLTISYLFDHWMLTLQEEKHVLCFDDKDSFYSSYAFTIQKLVDNEQADKNKNQPSVDPDNVDSFYFQIKVNHKFTYEWKSSYYKCEHIPNDNQFGSCPLSLQNYLQYYQDPKINRFRLAVNSELTEEEKKTISGAMIGKLIISTSFKGNIFKLPISILDKDNPRINIECSKKTLCVITEKNLKQSVICAAPIVSVYEVEEVTNFFSTTQVNPYGYMVYLFSIGQRVESQSVVVAKGKFSLKEVIFDKSTIKIYSKDNHEIFYMQGLMLHLQQLKIIMGEVEPLVIFQNVETNMEDGYRTVFYADSTSLFKRIYRSYLYDKIKDKWISEGMVFFNRNNKHFQDVMRELIDLMTEGEEITPLQDDTFSFDRVWRLKTIFFYHILSNFKNLRDYGSSSLANLIIEESRKKKLTSQMLFRRLKNKYGLRNFRTIYEHQFVKSTGLNRIFYQIIDLKRQNRVKIIVRQKSLINKLFRMYNYYRIKLQQEYDLISDVTTKIINKNNILDKSNKKKQFSGPLAVPRILKCLPYFKGTVSVETDASEMPFELQLREENIIEEKQSVTSKIRAPIRKIGEGQKSYEGFGWIMIDTAHIFPAVYKNQNVDESVILEKIKKKYDSEHQEIKMLNCISSKDHSGNQKICRALIEKVKININPKENCTINVKRKIIQILPAFLSKANDFSLWEDMLSFLKLYQPVCHDYSEDGYNFLRSLIESIGEIEYKKQFGYYFEQFHKIMLKILRTNNFNNEEKELKLKIALFSSLMKWKSCYSIQILQEIEIELNLSRHNVRASLETLKIIFFNIYEYIKSLKLGYNPTVQNINKLLKQLIKKDLTYDLFAIELNFQLQQLNQQLPQTLTFLKTLFGQLEEYKQQNLQKYGKALEVAKNILNKNKRIYGLELQLNLKDNEAFFIAQYLWKELTSPLTCHNHFIRLQWLKIYRIFYFYHVPIITLKKIKNNEESKSFKSLDSQGSKELLQKLKSFFPDIKWFSGYDSRSAKELKAKYEQMNESKRKKKVQQYNFSENNVITLFIKQHPGRESWDELAREAIRTFISIYEDKEQKSEGKQADRYKQIQEGFKKVEQKLKRGRMPDFYSYEQLKQEIRNLMVQFDEKEEKITDILNMVDKALNEIASERSKREAELKDEMKIVISFDSIQEEPEEEEEGPGQGQQEEGEENQANQGEGQEDEQLLFREQDNYQERSYQNGNADEDQEMFGA